MEIDLTIERIWKEILLDAPDWLKKSSDYVVELRLMADSIDEYHKDATKANFTGTCVGAVGGILSIAALVAPFTAGSSLVLAGLGVAAGVVGGATNVVASVSDNNNQVSKQKRVNEIVEDYEKVTKNLTEKLTQLNDALKLMLELEEKNLPNVALIGTARGLMNSLSFMTIMFTRRAVTVLKNLSGILALLTVAWDFFSIINDLQELGKQRTEISRMIREVANQIEKERDNFEKEYSKWKDCKKLNK
ncbi:apolipoprotein L5-like [Hypanus sabinus]|uniref:apolipoprotein L5-like n=1 Tax=Hypanus sabinus TaxID=79690 RepID=UPI0028C3EB47|nr:apolipoprotein L5-like [Hypanus sabinus]XP_059814352.1 apolipoprotein L5-like [Hypanus sabinus]XP_059814353.1 apolipoprotein L5-like [Hypanus sabinus]XP_059814354.1 apolipoprotein L5-like [Hypanus sabinus]XP_059814355.1 apolipoprotein L5-like [Hypanus sabinus]XP_059814356.1 apolipoprotein L5-like [Hypanus sabinus]